MSNINIVSQWINGNAINVGAVHLQNKTSVGNSADAIYCVRLLAVNKKYFASLVIKGKCLNMSCICFDDEVPAFLMLSVNITLDFDRMRVLKMKNIEKWC